MNKARKHVLWALLSAILVIFSGSGQLYAEDIEIFVASEDSGDDGGVLPNVMFIIDTSGSMRTEVQTQDAFDPTVEYTGSCDNNLLYITTTDTEPNCASSRLTTLEEKYNTCVSAQTNFSTGQPFLRDRMMAYNPANRTWGNLPNNADGTIDWYVDCSDDQSIFRRNGSVREQGDGLAEDDGLDARNQQSSPWSASTGRRDSFKAAMDSADRYYMWSGRVLNWGESRPIPKTRLETVQDVVVNLLDGLRDVNVGLMRFNDSQGGPVLIDIDDIESNRVTMQNAVRSLTPDGWTPLSETFYEFGQYMYGRNVKYGDGYQHRSVAGSRVGDTLDSKTYDSPTDFLCQKNYVIYLTDGEPTEDSQGESDIETWIGKSCANDHNNENGKCLDELAEYYANTPVLTDGQAINTYTIGFNIDLALMEDTAIKGNGEYFTADDTAELASSLTKITVEILKDATTFTAPAVTVNAFNRTRTFDTVYTAVFQPSASVHWPGNVKRYRFSEGKFLGYDGESAIDEETGFFDPDSWSYWSAEADGDTITRGGAASRLPEYGSRKIYTNLGNTSNGDAIIADSNRIVTTNTALTAETFGGATGTVDGAAETLDTNTAVIQWLNGKDFFNTELNFDANKDPIIGTRRQMGDPLHVRPVPVVYGGTVDNPDVVIYQTTNDGILHAIDAETGVELWSYIPGSVLDGVYATFKDELSTVKNYVLDGQIMIYNLNDDGLPGFNGADEKLIMVFGQRRGGTRYFALDITNKADPRWLWEISNDPNGQYPTLGQSWSEPQIGMVNMGNNDIPVAFIGGGYDTTQDSNVYSQDTVGNAVYMINLLTGEREWSASNTALGHTADYADMNYSMPAAPKIADINLDGLIDRLYIGDMGGQIWRFDFTNGNSELTFGSGGVLASLGAAAIGSGATALDLRRFYNQIDIMEDNFNGVRYFALNIGSGYRAHPLDRLINEEFYSIRDFKPYAILADDDDLYDEPVVRADLVDITTSSRDRNKTMEPLDAGWRLEMAINQGEKVLGDALTTVGVVNFTSFAPGGSANSCKAAQGTNYLYEVSVRWGRPVKNLDVIASDATYSQEDFGTLLDFGGLSPEPSIYRDANGDEYRCVGAECAEDVITRSPARTYWTQEGAQ